MVNDLLSQALLPVIRDEIAKSIDLDSIKKQVDELVAGAVASSTKLISISTNGGEPVNVGLAHKQFETITKVIASGVNLMLSGQAGNSKTHTLSQVAKGLGLEFHSISVSSQTTKSDLMGFIDANGVYRYNGFITAFRDGGLFNLDEIDAGNPNVLVVLNSAISNGFLEAPSGDKITKHENFRMCCTANTVGTGANSKYVGRNKLDGATLDRFAVIKFELDEDLEEKLCGNKEIASGFRAMRKLADKSFEDIMITMRSCIGTTRLYRAGLTINEALEIHAFKGLDFDAKLALKREFDKAYKKAMVANEPVVEVVKDIEVVEEVEIEEVADAKICPQCGKNMVLKKGKFGKFYGCNGYPKCTHTEKYPVNSDDPFNILEEVA